MALPNSSNWLKITQSLRLRLDLPALVVDFFDVRFAAGRLDDFGADRLEPLEAFARHLLGQDRDRRAAQQRRIERAAAAVVSGAGPDGFLRRGIELTGDQPRHEAAERRADFVCAGREILADEADDPRTARR